MMPEMKVNKNQLLGRFLKAAAENSKHSVSSQL